MMEPIVAALCARVGLQPPTLLWAARTTHPSKIMFDLAAAEPSISKAQVSDARAWCVAPGQIPICHSV